MEETDTLVIGGGISGLCAGFYRQQDRGGGSVVVLESADAPGGTARSDCEDGFVFEWGPNGFLDREPKTLEWVRDLGLDGDLITANEAAARRFLLRHGRLEQLVGPPRFLVSPLLSVPGRLRLLCEPLIRPKGDDTPESIWDFAARRVGREAADILVSSMVLGVFGGDAKALSLAHCFPRLADMERQHGSLFKALQAKRREQPGATAMGPGGVLTCFSKGMGTLVERGAARLGEAFRPATAVTAIRRAGSQFEAETAQGERYRAPNLILATPSWQAGDLLRDLDPDAAEACASIPYAGINVLCAAYRREAVGHDLDGFGYLVPRSEGRRALGCIWSSTVFPDHAPEGWVLLRVMVGGAVDPDAVQLSDQALADLLAREVHPLLGIATAPEHLRIYRYARGIPQYTLGHGTVLDRIEAAEARHPGLAFAGNAYWGVGVNDCVVTAHRALSKLEGRAAEAL